MASKLQRSAHLHIPSAKITCAQPHPSFFFLMWDLIVQLRASMYSEHSASPPASHFLSLKDGSNPVSLDPDSTTELVLAEPYKPVPHFFPS